MDVLRQTKSRSARTRRVLAIPIFCGIFSFCHWFIFFPVVWHFLAPHGIVRFWIYALIVFVLWLLVMALCMSCWWYDKKRITPVEKFVKDANTHYRFDRSLQCDSPIVKTHSTAIQLGSKVKSNGDYDSDKELTSLRSVPVQPQNTPALYNLHTGRHSYDSIGLRNSSDSYQKTAPEKFSEVILVKRETTNVNYKTISLSDSEKSTNAVINERPGGYEVLLTTGTQTKLKTNGINQTVQATVEGPTQQQEIQIRTKHDHVAAAQQPTKVTLASDSGDDDELMFQHIDMDIRLSDQNIGGNHHSDGRPSSQSGEIEHLKEPYSPDADRLSQNMPEFDDYLHLVSIETPLSPREVFFSDLIKQANETEQKSLKVKEGAGDRRSYCIGDITYNKMNYDDRKSVPLFLYSDQWRQDGQNQEEAQVPEQNVDSDDNQYIDQLTDDHHDENGQKIQHERQPESPLSALKVVEVCPNVDLKIVTQMFINQEKLNSYPPEIVKKPKDVSSKRNHDVEDIDITFKPKSPQGKPLKLIEAESDQIREPKTKPSQEMKEVFEPEMEKMKAKSRCCEDEPGASRPKEDRLPVNKKRMSSEYFIADVDSLDHKLAMSEVFLTVGDSGIVSNVSGHQEWKLTPQMSGLSLQNAGIPTPTGTRQEVIAGYGDMKRELSSDKLEYKSEDDEVFEDVQSSLSKLRRHK